MAETPCPTTWCKERGDHVLHFSPGAYLPPDTVVTVNAAFDEPAQVSVTSGGPPAQLTPLAARTLGRALIARGRDAELGELLIQAADLAKDAR